MINLRLFSVLFSSMMLVSSLGYAEIYKWKDAEGKVRYSDIPPAGNTKFELINSKKTAADTPLQSSSTKPLKMDTAPVVNLNAKNAKEATGIQDDEKRDKLKEQAEKEAAKEQAQNKQNTAALKEENCKAAKTNQATYKNGGRIKKVNEKGEPGLMTDAEIASAKLDAEKEVAKYCNS